MINDENEYERVSLEYAYATTRTVHPHRG